MAKELFSSADVPPTLRFLCDHDKRKTVKIAPIAGAPMLMRLTPMAYNTSTNKWVPFIQGVVTNGVGIVSGFLVSGHEDSITNEVVQTHATEDSSGVMAYAGNIHVDDIALYGANTKANILAVIKTSKLSDAFSFQGMDNDAYFAR